MHTLLIHRTCSARSYLSLARHIVPRWTTYRHLSTPNNRKGLTKESESNNASTKSSPTATFSPPPNSPSAFLAELRAFAGQSPKSGLSPTSLPLTFSGDANLILSGARRVMSRESEFNFACSACGDCCKSYPNDVMVDPHDVFLISRAKGWRATNNASSNPNANESTDEPNSTTLLFQTYPKAFQGHLGLFESAEHLIEESANSPSSPLLSRHKLAPALFLRTKRVKQVSRANQRISTVTERCWFSAPTQRHEIEMVEEDDTNSSTMSSTRSIRSPHNPNTTKPKSGLTCILGPSHQPTSCALYPLGELYNKKISSPSSSPSSSTSSKQFPSSDRIQYWSLDTTNCEGTKVVPTSSTRMTVDSYARRNDLDSRRLEWDWFEELARRFASYGWLTQDVDDGHIIPLSDTMRMDLHNLISAVWYNFDSLELAPKHSSSPSSYFADWPSARQAISRATDDIIQITQEYINNIEANKKAEPLAQREWKRKLKEKGIALRTDLQPPSS